MSQIIEHSLLFDILGNRSYLIRPEISLGTAFRGPPVSLAADITRLVELRPAWQPWLRLAQQLAGAETQRGEAVQFGAEPPQHPLPFETSMA